MVEHRTYALRGTSWRAGDANGTGNRMNDSGSQVDGSMAQTDAPIASNSVGDAKCDIHEMDGVASHTDAITLANAPEIISIPQK